MRIVLAITGGSGAIYPHQLISYFERQDSLEVHIIASANGRRIFREERGIDLKEATRIPVHGHQDFDTPFVSGSNPFDAMVIAPCSMGTLGRIAHGISGDALTRTADVFLKERRKLILVPREMPLSTIHLNNLNTLSQQGATIIPAMPAFYGLPQTIDELAATVTARILDHLGLNNALAKRWKENES